MGPNDPKMTMRYTPLSLDYKRQAVAQLERESRLESQQISRRRVWVNRTRSRKLLRTSDAKVAELADALDLGSSGATHEGSSPSFRM